MQRRRRNRAPGRRGHASSWARDSYATVSRFNGKPAAGVAIKLATGANALATGKAVEAKLKRSWSPFFPRA